MADELKQVMELVSGMRAEVEINGKEAGEVKAKLAKMEADLAVAMRKQDELDAKANRPSMDAKAVKAAEYDKQKNEFNDILQRKGNYQISGNSTGGYTVPTLIFSEIVRLQRDFDPVRKLARVISTSSGSPLYVPRVTTNQTGGFTTETAARSLHDAAVFEQRPLTPFPVESYTQLSYALAEDSAFDIGSFIMEEAARTLAYHEGKAFIDGNGTTAPSGILSDAGVTGNYETAGNDVLTADALVKVPFKIRSVYHDGAVYLMKPSTMAAAVTLKEEATAGGYYFHPEPTGPYRYSFNGFPCYLSDSVPALGDKVNAVIFGNLYRGYLINDIAGSMHIVVDPYTAPGHVKYFVTKRVAGNVVDPAAFAVVVTS